MAGPVPAISIRQAQRTRNRDARAKPAHDALTFVMAAVATVMAGLVPAISISERGAPAIGLRGPSPRMTLSHSSWPPLQPSWPGLSRPSPPLLAAEQKRGGPARASEATLFRRLKNFFDIAAGRRFPNRRSEEAGVETKRHPCSSRLSRMSRRLGVAPRRHRGRFARPASAGKPSFLTLGFWK
jgi:hypothetical protein